MVGPEMKGHRVLHTVMCGTSRRKAYDGQKVLSDTSESSNQAVTQEVSNQAATEDVPPVPSTVLG